MDFAALPTAILLHGRMGSSVHAIVREATFHGASVVAKSYFVLHSPDSFGIEASALQRLCSLLLADLRVHWHSRHPNIAQLLGLTADSFGTPIWIVAEKPDVSLLPLLAHPARPAMLGNPLAHDLFSALSFLHSRGVAHGNIKPSNIVVLRGSFQLTDFAPGTFRTELAHILPLAPPSTLYTAPEHVLGDGGASSAGDVFAAGVVLAQAAPVVSAATATAAAVRAGLATNLPTPPKAAYAAVDVALLQPREAQPPADLHERIAWAHSAWDGVLPVVATAVRASVVEAPGARATATTILSSLPHCSPATRAAVAAVINALLCATHEAAAACEPGDPVFRGEENENAHIVVASHAETVAEATQTTGTRPTVPHSSRAVPVYVESDSQTDPMPLPPPMPVFVPAPPPPSSSVESQTDLQSGHTTPTATPARTPTSAPASALEQTASPEPAPALAPALADQELTGATVERVVRDVCEVATQTEDAKMPEAAGTGAGPAVPTTAVAAPAPAPAPTDSIDPGKKQADEAHQKSIAFVAGLAAMEAPAVDALVADPAAIGAVLTRLAAMATDSATGLRVLIGGLTRATPAEITPALLSGSNAAMLLEATQVADAQAREALLKMLAAFVFKNTPNQIHLLRSGAVPAIVRVMTSDIVPGVQEHACRVLSSLALSPDEWKPAWRGPAAEAAVRALRLCPDPAGLALQACALLTNLGSTSEGQIAAVRVLGHVAVVSAMLRHGSNAGVQDQACRALRTLSGRNGENQAALAEAGGAVAIVRAMFQHWSAANVIEQALRALREIVKCGTRVPSASSTPPSMLRRPGSTLSSPFKTKAKDVPEPPPDTDAIPEGDSVSDGQIIYAVVRGMGSHPGSAAVQEQGLVILRTLAYRNPDNQVLVTRRGGLSAMMLAMRTHPAALTLQEEACRLIANLAENASIASEVLSPRVQQTVQAAQLANPRNTHIEVCAHLFRRV